MVCWRSSRINDQELMQRETETVRAQLESTSLLTVLSTPIRLSNRPTPIQRNSPPHRIGNGTEHLSGLQKNIDTLKKVQSAPGS